SISPLASKYLLKVWPRRIRRSAIASCKISLGIHEPLLSLSRILLGIQGRSLCDGSVFLVVADTQRQMATVLEPVAGLPSNRVVVMLFPLKPLMANAPGLWAKTSLWKISSPGIWTMFAKI